jgi:hypothetical protein
MATLIGMDDDYQYEVSNEDLVREGIDATHFMGQQLLHERLPHLYGDAPAAEGENTDATSRDDAAGPADLSS